MNSFLHLFLLLLFSLASTVLADADAETPPNVIIILTDDQGWSDVGCYGCEDIPTPHTDQLAADGIRFTQAYVTHPYCSPSRAGLLSGRYQQSFGHEHNPKYNLNDATTGIPPNVQLMPQTLAPAGYVSAGIGKWHLGAGEPFQPHNRGFDHYWGFLGGGHYYFNENIKHSGNSYQSKIWIDGHFTDTPISYMTDDLTDAALRFIDNHAEQPFMVYLAYNAPHSPDQAKREDLEQFGHIQHRGRRAYAAMVKNIDDNVGRIMAHLDAHNLRNNTLVFFLSDNGGRRRLADNRPLRGNKGWLCEGGIRVPFIANWPGKIPAGTTCDHPVISLDIFATIVDLADIQPEHDLHGTSLVPYWNSDHDPGERTLHWRVCGGKGWAIRRGNWKLVGDVPMQQPELYDLQADPEERFNLAAEHPQRVADLLQVHEAWNATLVTPVFADDGHAKTVAEEYNSTGQQPPRHFRGVWWE